MIQLVAPNLATAGRLGFCLEYADRAFGIGSGEPTAWQAWNATAFKHQNMNLPTDVAVPIWFSYYQNGVNFGHVAINVPGKGIYSSPWQLGTNHAVLTSISSLISIYSNNGAHPMMYVGWSEDISKVRVVKESDMPLTPGQLDKLIKAMKQAEPSADELNNPDWLNNPGLAVDALWNNYGVNHYPPTPSNQPAQVLKPGVYEVK